MIKNGAKLSHKDKSGYTALVAAAHNGHLDMMELLLKCSENKDHQKQDGDMALHIAVIVEI